MSCNADRTSFQLYESKFGWYGREDMRKKVQFRSGVIRDLGTATKSGEHKCDAAMRTNAMIILMNILSYVMNSPFSPHPT